MGGTAMGVEDPGAVTSLTSTSHAVSTASKTNQISMSWSEPTGYTTISGYYTVFSTSSTYSPTSFTGDPKYKETKSVTSTALSDGTYYFHISAVDTDGDTGTMATAGPFIIDTTAPTNQSVDAPGTTTSTLSITLTLAATGATQMNISNTAFGAGSWDTYATSKSWTLTSGTGEKTIFVQFRDSAGNTANAQDNITYTPGAISLTAKQGDVTVTTIAAGTTVTFSADGGVEPYTYTAVESTVSGFDAYTSNATGSFTPLGSGKFKVQAEDKDGTTGTSDELTVTKTAISPTGDITLVSGGTATQQFTASGGNGSYTWAVTSTGDTIGTVTAAGLFTAYTPGTGNVVVSDSNGYTDTSGTITVGSMVISPNTKIMVKSTTQDFSVSGGTAPYTWTASGGATINAGPSTYTATFTAPSTTGNYTVGVEETGAGTASSGTIQVVDPIVVGVKGQTEGTVIVAIGDSFALTVTGGTGGGTNTNYTWESSATSVATVDSGNFVSQAPGTCTITATDKTETSISGTSTTVQVVGEITSISIELNSSKQCVVKWTAPGGTFNVYYSSSASSSPSDYTNQLGGDISTTIASETYGYTDTTSTDASERYYMVKLKGTDISSISKGGVGKYTLNLTKGFNLISCPFSRTYTDVNNVVGNQLTGSLFPTTADRIHFFDGTSYEWIFLNSQGVWSESNGSTTQRTISPEKGYWIEIYSGNTDKDVVLTGVLPTQDQAITIADGFNLIGNPYPYNVALSSDTSFASSGGVGNLFPTNADRIYFFDGTSYEWVYLNASGNWKESDGSSTTRSLESGKAFWVKTLKGSTWTWTLPVPY